MSPCPVCLKLVDTFHNNHIGVKRMDISGKRVAIIGTFRGTSFRKLKDQLTTLGATATKTIGPRTDLVVAGARAGDKLDAAKLANLQILDADQFASLLEGTYQVVAVSESPSAEAESDAVTPPARVVELIHAIGRDPEAHGFDRFRFHLGWLELCGMLDGVSPAEQAGAVQLLEETDDAWPHHINMGRREPGDELRFAPNSWLPQLLGGKDSPKFGALRVINAGLRDITGKAAMGLTECHGLTNLRGLNLSGNKLNAAFYKALSASPIGARLTHLMLSHAKAKAGVMKDLAASPHLGELTWLDVAGEKVGKKGAEAIASGPWTKLDHLNLSHCFLTDAGAAALAEAPWLGDLRYLNLASNDLTAAGLETLLSRLDKVETLVLTWGQFGERGARALANAEHLKSLKRLSLDSCEMTTEACRVLAEEAPHLASLAYLALMLNPADATVWELFAGSSYLGDVVALK